VDRESLVPKPTHRIKLCNLKMPISRANAGNLVLPAMIGVIRRPLARRMGLRLPQRISGNMSGGPIVDRERAELAELLWGDVARVH